MIEFPSAGHIGHGYLATPAAGAGPGVLVIQEWWGLVPHIKSVCDRLAGAGFTALAPDLYHGRSTQEPDEAQKEMMNLNIEEAARDLSGAVAHLLDSPNATSRTTTRPSRASRTDSGRRGLPSNRSGTTPTTHSSTMAGPRCSTKRRPVSPGTGRSHSFASTSAPDCSA